MTQNGKPLPKPEMIETSTALESLTRGEVDMQVATAKKYPRDLQTFRQRAMSMATRDPETAALCEYHIPRGEGITGPSVRLAEIIASSWGNLRAEARPLSEDDRYVTSQASVWDLETNFAYRHETRRRITNKSGARYGDDMINVTANAAASIALREAIFHVVPRSEWLRVYEASQKAAAVDVNKLGELRKQWIATFGKAKISEARVLKFLGVGAVDDIGAEDIKLLKGIYTALAEGAVSVNDIFPPDDLEPGRQSASGKTKGKGKTKDKPKPEAQTAPPPAEAKPAKATKPAEAKPRDDRAPLLQTMDLIKSATNKDELDRVYVAEIANGLEPRKEIRDAIEKQWAAMQTGANTETGEVAEEEPPTVDENGQQAFANVGPPAAKPGELDEEW